MASFPGKTVLITGASRGQGAAEAKLFAQNGARVIVADVLDAEGEAVVAEIRTARGKADYVHLDVANEADWEKAIAFAKDKCGGLHVLVNNAGVALRGKNIGATTREDWDRVLSINLTGPFLGTRAAAPLIRDSGGGSIVNTGSTAGINGHFAAAWFRLRQVGQLEAGRIPELHQSQRSHLSSAPIAAHQHTRSAALCQGAQMC